MSVHVDNSIAAVGASATRYMTKIYPVGTIGFDNRLTIVFASAYSTGYVDFLNTWTAANSANPSNQEAYCAAGAGGNLLVGSTDGVSGLDQNIWTDGYAGRFWLGTSYLANGSTGTVSCCYLREDGSFVVPTLAAAPLNMVPDQIDVFADLSFLSTVHGIEDCGCLKIWGRGMTVPEMRAEMGSRRPKNWDRLLFWNPMISAARCFVDYSGRGGDFTPNVLPQDGVIDPFAPYPLIGQ